MQPNKPKLLNEYDLDSHEREMEKTDCIHSLLEHLDSMQWNGMEYVLSNPRFQVIWRKACRLFWFYSSEMTRCSVSNITAFQEMVQKEYPHMIQEMTTNNGERAVNDILDAIRERNYKIIEEEGQEDWLNRLYICPVELLEMIWIDGINACNQSTTTLLSLLRWDMNAWKYLPHFNRYIAEHFTHEVSIRKLFLPISPSSSQSLSWYIDGLTTLHLISRLKSWDGLFDRALDWSWVDCNRLHNTLPQEFLELIHKRNNRIEIEKLSSYIIVMMNHDWTMEDTVFPLALTLLDIEENKEAEKRKRKWIIIFDWESSPPDKIRAILAKRFPERYISTLEKLVDIKKEDWNEKNPDITVSSLWDDATRYSIATSHPERYLSIVPKLSDRNIFLALSTSGRNDREIIDSLTQAGFWPRVANLVLGLNIEQWRTKRILMALAKSNPQEFAQKVLDLGNAEKRAEWNIFDNPLDFREILQTLIIGWAGEKVLAILDSQGYNDINIHTHALLYKHVQDVYTEMAKVKKFDFETVAREMVHGSTSPLNELVDYIIQYAFSESAFHARESYSEFLASRWELKASQ